VRRMPSEARRERRRAHTGLLNCLGIHPPLTWHAMN